MTLQQRIEARAREVYDNYKYNTPKEIAMMKRHYKVGATEWAEIAREEGYYEGKSKEMNWWMERVRELQSRIAELEEKIAVYERREIRES